MFSGSVCFGRMLVLGKCLYSGSVCFGGVPVLGESCFWGSVCLEGVFVLCMNKQASYLYMNKQVSLVIQFTAAQSTVSDA